MTAIRENPELFAYNPTVFITAIDKVVTKTVRK